MILTRSLINQNLTFEDVGSDWVSCQYTMNDVNDMIHCYKNLLQHTYCCKPGQRVLIALEATAAQVALTLACAELALPIVIVDHDGPVVGSMQEFIENQTQSLLPIDFLFIETHARIHTLPKLAIYRSICNTTVMLEDCEFDHSPNHTVWAQDQTDLVIFASHGKSPRLISHSHDFMSKLSQRNSTQFRGTVGMRFNLQHGSSLATYFLPALMSNKVNVMINFRDQNRNPDYFARMSSYRMDHLMLPYAPMLHSFFESSQDHSNPTLIVYTLGFISPSYAYYVSRKRAQNVVSMFGTGETSGPIFVNRLMPFETFDPRLYHKVDEFYHLSFDENNIMTVRVPEHELTVVTNDCFEQQQGTYRYHGRQDLVRINNWPINIDRYNDLVANLAEKNSYQVIADFVEDKLYLVSWNNELLNKKQLETLNYHLGQDSGWTHSISKHTVLDPEKYDSNTEDILQHFRHAVYNIEV